MEHRIDRARPQRPSRPRRRTDRGVVEPPVRREPGEGKGRISALEGIRTLSIVAILLYHADPSWLPGGFFGVSVFFVLTGYLITLSLERGIAREKRLDYPRFLAKRVGRMLPSMLVLVGVVAILCAFFSPSGLAT